MEKELERLSEQLKKIAVWLDSKYDRSLLEQKVLTMNRINELNRKLYSK